jgi:hypothetical protein
VPALTTSPAALPKHDATVLAPSEIAACLQEQLGQRIGAHLVGLADTRQLARYSRADAPAPSQVTIRRLREAYKVVRMIAHAYDAEDAEIAARTTCCAPTRRPPPTRSRHSLPRSAPPSGAQQPPVRTSPAEIVERSGI